MTSPTPNQNSEQANAQMSALSQVAKQLGLDVVRIDGGTPQPSALALINEPAAKEHRLVPLQLDGKSLVIAVADPSMLSKPAPVFLQTLKKQGYKLKLMLTPPADFELAIAAYGKNQQAEPMANATPAAQPTQAVPATTQSVALPSVNLIGRIIAQAVIERFPEDVARKYQIVVFELSPNGKEASVAALDPSDPRIREILKFVEQRNQIRIHLYKTDRKSIENALLSYPQKTSKTEPVVPAVPAPVVPAQSPVVPTSVAVPLQSPSVTPASLPQPGQAAQPLRKVGAVAPVVPSVPTPQQPVPVVQLGQLASTAGMSVPAGASAPVQVAEEDLDKLLGQPVTDEAGFERAVKTGAVPTIIAAAISYAAQLAASDVHIEAGEASLRIRFRIDGKLRDVIKLPIELLAPLVSRVKILAKLKIDETRLPQDGRFNVRVNKREVDLRVSTLPTVRGEKIVLRLLDKSGGVKNLEVLGLSGSSLKKVTQAIKEPFGIILVSGPTGSGKTTTLYAMLTELNKPEVNIVTLEDPVEYQVEGINQTQVKPKIGYGFADGLRSILRQDPNIVMVGEIRDAETAGLATQAALTGHLVLSTLHTNSAAGAIPRLIDMNVEPFLIASSLTSVIAQRLVRRLCEECRTPAQLPPETIEEVRAILSTSVVPAIKERAAGDFAFFTANGCEKCQDGYRGRIGMYEVLTMTESIGQLAIQRAAASAIDEAARREGMITLQQDGILKALDGITSLDEVMQATAE